MNYATLLDKADQLVEIVVYDHFSKVPDYVHYFETAKQAGPHNQILPIADAQLNLGALGDINEIINSVPPKLRGRLMFLATNTILPTCSKIGLIGYLTFKNITFNGHVFKFYSVFIIDGLVYDFLRNVVGMPLMAYLSKLFVQNEVLYISKSYSSYVPSDMFKYYLGLRQWIAITRRVGVTREELRMYGLDT